MEKGTTLRKDLINEARQDVLDILLNSELTELEALVTLSCVLKSLQTNFGLRIEDMNQISEYVTRISKPVLNAKQNV